MDSDVCSCVCSSAGEESMVSAGAVFLRVVGEVRECGGSKCARTSAEKRSPTPEK